MLLFIATDTTRPWLRPPGHLVRLAALLCNRDGSRDRELNSIIIPDGWTIPRKATEIHRITTDRAFAFGEPLRDVILKFNEFMLSQAKLLIGCNIELQINVLRKAFEDADMPSDVWNGPTRCITPPATQRYSAMDSVLACREIYLSAAR